MMIYGPLSAIKLKPECKKIFIRVLGDLEPIKFILPVFSPTPFLHPLLFIPFALCLVGWNKMDLEIELIIFVVFGWMGSMEV